MSVAIQFDVVRDTASPALAEKLRKCNPHVIATRIAPPLASHWRDHIKSLPRNKEGYPSTGFWEGAARRTIGVAVGGVARLSCDKLGMRKRFYGGPVVATRKANLTIPICAEAYGTTAKDWGDTLTPVVMADGKKFLALWLGEQAKTNYSETVQRHIERFNKRKASGKLQMRANETLTRKVRQFSEWLFHRPTKFGSSGLQRPKVIVFKKSTGSTIARAEKHMELKFLFKLQPETGAQVPMPQVIPPNLADMARKEVLEAIK